MYNASNAFHTAVANGAPQIALIIFDDAVFTNDDIDVQEGISFHDYFNTEDDLTIGSALSNEITFSVFNDTGLLDTYEFGDFTATIGVMTAEETASRTYPYLDTGAHVYAVQNDSPYITRDGVDISTPPAKRPVSMLYYDGVVYCYLTNGTVAFYEDSTGEKKTGMTTNSFMRAQIQKWEGKGIAYQDNTLNVWAAQYNRTYEFVPLGRFNAERPNVPTVNRISMTCYDLMQRFDVDMPSDSDLGITYPISFTNLFVKLATYADVPYSTSGITINANAQLTARPERFDNATMREVLQWLAEATGNIARFNRDGVLVMDWIHTVTNVIDETMYSEFNPYWYETKQIDKLHNRASSGEYNRTRGDGNEGYLIQDNPLLEGVS